MSWCGFLILEGFLGRAHLTLINVVARKNCSVMYVQYAPVAIFPRALFLFVIWTLGALGGGGAREKRSFGRRVRIRKNKDFVMNSQKPKRFYPLKLGASGGSARAKSKPLKTGCEHNLITSGDCRGEGRNTLDSRTSDEVQSFRGFKGTHVSLVAGGIYSLREVKNNRSL